MQNEQAGAHYPEQFATEPDIKEKIHQILTEGSVNNQLPESVFILSGGIKPESVARDNPEDDGYRSLAYSDTDGGGLISGGKARVIAGAEIAKHFPEITIVTTSVEKSGDLSHASVMKEELMHRGVEEERILMEEQSTNTVSELTEMLLLAIENGWKKIGLVTSEYHIPRVSRMLELLEPISRDVSSEFANALRKYQDGELEVVMIPAESVLESVSSKYKLLFDQVRNSKEYNLRQAAEAQGITDLNNGSYDR